MGGAKLFLALALVATTLSLAACGGDDEDEGGTTTGAEDVETTAGGGETGTTADEGEPILIKTHVDALEDPEAMTTGQVLSGSTIGDSAFCRGGTFRDAAVQPPDSLVTRLFRCPGGELTITFTSTPPDVPQRSEWEVVRGTGTFEGLGGGGRMRAVSESSTGEARETFTGTITR